MHAQGIAYCRTLRVTCYYCEVMTDNNNKNQVSDKDDDPTVELEPLSEEDCAGLALAAESFDASGAVAKRNEARPADVGTQLRTQKKSQAADHALEDALTFRDGGSSPLEAGLTEQREEYNELVAQLASLKATNAEINDKLDRKCREVAKKKIEIEQLRDRERELLTKLSELRKSDGIDAATADQSRIIEELIQNNEILTGTVSALEGELNLARCKSRQLETRLGEAENGSGTRVGEATWSGAETAIGPESSRWVLVSLDDRSTGTYRLSEGIVTVGSSPDNDIHIQSQFISRKHAHFVSTHKACVLGDLNSTNGTYVNSRRINKRVLRVGDVVTFGKHRFRYEERTDGPSGREQIEYESNEHSRTH